MTRKRHHVVSKFYLNLFSNEKGKAARLHFLNVRTRKAGWAYTDDLCVKKGFNSVEAVGLPSDAIEVAWSKEEADIAPLVREIVEKKDWVSNTHYSNLIYLIAMFGVRSLHFRGKLTEFTTRTYKAILNANLATEDRFSRFLAQAREAGHITSEDVSYEQVRRGLLDGNVQIVPDKTGLILSELDAIEGVCEVLDQRYWSFLEAPTGSPFVTSDRPVSLLWSGPEGSPPPLSMGFGTLGTSVIFPLSPQLCLRGEFKKLERRHTLSPEQVAKVNLSIMAACEELTLSGSEEAAFSDGRSLYRWKAILDDLDEQSERPVDR